MGFFTAPLPLLASVALWGHAQASYLNNDLSFGHNGKISPNLRAVPNYHLQGIPNPPEILSNKIVLTPPAPGNQRGAAWADKPLLHSLWTADIDFRATGPERGGGNLQIWYAAKGQTDVGTSSIYTAGRFDGLALVIDQYAGSGGYIRGFLNDGTTEYKSHHSIDSLAFGHCEYSYRNLGRPSRITIRQSIDKFSVEVDGKACFDSAQIKLPLGYSFGVTAASAETPDSFEVFKFVVTTESHTPDVTDPNQAAANNYGEAQAPIGGAPSQDQKQTRRPAFNGPPITDIPEVLASTVKDQAAQFADLHDRLQALTQHVNSLHSEIGDSRVNTNSRFDGLAADISRLESQFTKLDTIADLNRKLDSIQADVRQTKSDLHNALDQHVAGLRNEVRGTHATLLGTVAGSAPGISGFILAVLASQGLLVLAYVLYKRRKANGPKKYL